MAGSGLRNAPPADTGLVRPGGPAWPVRSGLVPAVAEGSISRPETSPDLPAALAAGSVLALVSSEPQQAESCGKTQLAVSWAEALWRGGQVSLLAWVDASSRASLLTGLAEAAVAVGIDLAAPAEQVAARFTDWLAETARPWLVVLDDLRDPADLGGLRPYGPAGTVLITAPNEDTVAGQPQTRILPVGVFSPREAVTYLIGRLATDTDQRQGAIGLAAELGYEPTALAQASAVIAGSLLTCQDYRQSFTRWRQELTGPAGSTPHPAAVTWKISAGHAERLAPGGATQLQLTLAALLDGHAIPGTVFTTPATRRYLGGVGAPAADARQAWEAVQALEDTGLLAIDSAAGSATVRMSPALQAHIQAATPEPMLRWAVQAAADALADIWPEPEPPPMQAVILCSCVSALQRTAGDRLWAPGGCHPVLLRVGHSLDAARLSGPAARYWTQLAATSHRILGPGHPDTLAAVSRQARALLAAGQATEAAARCQQVAAGYARLSGPGHPNALAAQVSLGQALAAAGQAGHAAVILDQAAARYQRALGADHPDTVRAYDELAAACQAAGRTAEAMEHYRHVLAVCEHLHGPRHLATLTARDKLADACLAGGRHWDAISSYRRALADREQALGSDHLDTIAARRTLAAAYYAAGKIAAALRLYEQACADYQHALGADHPRTLTCRADLASAYHHAGRLTDAATLLRDTLTRCEQALPSGDPLTRALRQAMTGISGT